MSDKDTTQMAHAACTADSSPSQENSVHVLKDKDLAISLDNINKNMGKMASILAELYDQLDTDERPPSLKRKSMSDLQDVSDSDSEGNSRQSGKKKRYDNQTVGNLSLHASDDELDDENYIQRLKCVQRPTAKNSGKLPLRKQSSFKILPTVTTRMTPPATKRRKS